MSRQRASVWLGALLDPPGVAKIEGRGGCTRNLMPCCCPLRVLVSRDRNSGGWQDRVVHLEQQRGWKSHEAASRM
jgi:hypothetical protein